MHNSQGFEKSLDQDLSPRWIKCVIIFFSLNSVVEEVITDMDNINVLSLIIDFDFKKILKETIKMYALDSAQWWIIMDDDNDVIHNPPRDNYYVHSLHF